MLTRRQFMVAAGVTGLWPSPGVRAALGGQAGRAAAAPLEPGRYALELELDRDGLFYLPSGYTAGAPMPLVVLLHGAGGSSESAVGAFPLADELGFIILATDAKDWTWDAIIRGFGPDLEFLQRAIVHVMPIDVTSRKFVPRLKTLGYDVTYREFDGKHVLPPELRREAYSWWVEGSKSA